MTVNQQSKCYVRKHTRTGFASFYLASLLLVFSLLRLVLFVQFGPSPAPASGQILRTFLIGFHLDVYVALLFTLPLLFWFWIVPARWFRAKWHRRLFAVGFFLFWTVEVFLLIAEFYFFDEFKSRFNTVAVDYLLYPHEVFINIWDEYPVVLIVLLCTACAAAWLWLAQRWFGRMWSAEVPRIPGFAPFATGTAITLLLTPTVGFQRSRFSDERLLNELANNGVMSFVAAAVTRQLDYAAFYKTMPLDAAYARVRKLLSATNAAFMAEGQSIRRKVDGDLSRPKLNVVLVLVESFGSEFWGSLGRPDPTMTPEMDKLAAEEGMLFTNIYATGNRTVRGFEGILSSFPPLPGDSIVKRHLSDNVESIARVLKRDGYQTLFLYGGRGVFDGMRSYAVRNGWDRFIEQTDFEKPIFTTIWGVCDEDLFNRGVTELRAMHDSGKPFLATFLTVSNHRPYTYPEGRIPEDPNKRWRHHAVKYCDYALGQFIKAAKEQPFWTNTIFVIVADHGARVYGSQSIPIKSYEIPWLIVGPAVVKGPSRVAVLGGCLDVAPTVLGMIGRPYETMFFGRDLLNTPPSQAFVLVNHNRDIGIYRDERLVTLGLMHTAEYYQGDPKAVNLTPFEEPSPRDVEIENDAVALFQVADDLYMNRRFCIDPPGATR
jgi:phosphoglycerol transferase MdoB-like AlkP superfamily enzyme